MLPSMRSLLPCAVMRLAALSSSLDGEDAQGGSNAEGLPLGWQGLNRQYERRFGIPPEQATPPPGR